MENLKKTIPVPSIVDMQLEIRLKSFTRKDGMLCITLNDLFKLSQNGVETTKEQPTNLEEYPDW